MNVRELLFNYDTYQKVAIITMYLESHWLLAIVRPKLRSKLVQRLRFLANNDLLAVKAITDREIYIYLYTDSEVLQLSGERAITHQPALVWWVMARFPYVHKEGLCSSSGVINRLMTMMMMTTAQCLL
jgi:hypothetical protein